MKEAMISEGKKTPFRFEMKGEVIGNKMNKTISVLTVKLRKHKKYGKYVRKKSIFKAHDEHNQAQVGDFVTISATRPLSKTKRWVLKKVLEKSKHQDRGKTVEKSKEALSLQGEDSSSMKTQEEASKKTHQKDEALSERGEKSSKEKKS